MILEGLRVERRKGGINGRIGGEGWGGESLNSFMWGFCFVVEKNKICLVY
jgi:hypothetical protein